MNYTFNELHSKKILYVQLSDEGNVSDIKDLIFKARSKAFSLNYNLLYDFTNFVNHIQVSEIYNLYRGDLTERLLKVNSEVLKIKVAIIGNTKDAELWDFTQTTFNNAGISIKVFYDKSLAIKWLKGSVKTKSYT